jgi:nucleoside-diphosphate-sugar epimerase
MTGQKRALVTGAGGFVCRHIISALLNDGYAVVAVDRAFDPDLLAAWRDMPIEILQADSQTIPDMTVDAVIHGAALTASAEESDLSPENHLRANLEPTLTMLEWAARNHVRRTVCVSSSAVYATTNGVVTEDMPPTPDNLYAIAKAATESLVKTLRSTNQRDAITIRLSNVYGAGERSRATRPRASLVGQMVESALTSGRIRVQRPDEMRDWTFAPDIGRAVRRLLKQETLNHALYNIASEQRLTARQLAEAIAEHIPATQIIESAEAGDQSPLTRQGYLSHQRLQDETGFTNWTPIKDGLARVIADNLEAIR